MNHLYEMHLQEEYFEKVRNKEKRIEYRLLDAKRKPISTGDYIVFHRSGESKQEEEDELIVRVGAVFKDSNFISLRDRLIREGLINEKEFSLPQLRNLYSIIQEKEYSVVAFEIELVEGPCFIFGYNHCLNVVSKIVEGGYSLKEREISRFRYDGIVMSELEQLQREIQRLRSSLAFDIDFNYTKYVAMNKILKVLENQISTKPSDIELLRRIIVHMDMEFCLDFSFYTTFDYINRHCNPMFYCYDNNPQDFSFFWLSKVYGEI